MTKNEKFKKIRIVRKNRNWPTVVLFVASCVASLVLIAVFITTFISYIISSKMMNIEDNVKNTARIINAQLVAGNDIDQSLEFVQNYLGREAQVTLTDKDGELISNFEPSGDFITDFKEMESLGEKYVLSIDDVNSAFDRMRFDTPLKEVMKKTFEMDKFAFNKDKTEWFGEDVFSRKVVMQVPLENKDYFVNYEGALTISRQDVLFILLLCGTIIGLLMIPLIFMFVNTISTLKKQRFMTIMLTKDPVTKGNNWVFFKEKAAQYLRKYSNARKMFAMVDIELDNYQNFCAFYGTREGEELLESMSAYLQVKMEKDECFGHNGKSDFGILLRCKSKEEVEKRVRTLLVELSGLKSGQRLYFYAGIYLIEPMEQNDKKLIRRKDTDIDLLHNYAVEAREYVAADNTKRMAFFNEEMLNDKLWEKKVETTMESALANREFEVYLQPKFNPVNRKMVGAEALVRWMSPTDGMIPPYKFIPIFEENGFIAKLDDYMLTTVSKLQSEWEINGIKSVPISVNVSRANFVRPDLAEHICRLVDSYGTSHKMIELEVTESAFFDDKKVMINTVKELQNYGFDVAVDDFGAGYSSLNSLKDLPINVLKLDAEFFRGDLNDERSEIVVREVITLAKSLDMKTVAEGIEMKEQVEFLAGLGCDMIQGFYFAKPMPVDEFVKMIQAQV